MMNSLFYPKLKKTGIRWVTTLGYKPIVDSSKQITDKNELFRTVSLSWYLPTSWDGKG
jgi:hypothetical protein